MTQFEYNARSQMTKVKDALNQEYVFAYDALGRQLSQTRVGGAMSFVYDAVGNRTKRTDYLNRETTYEYDNLNCLKKINYLQDVPNTNPSPTPLLTASFNYDDLSRLTSAVNDAGTVSFTYDTRGRVKTSTDVFGHLVEYGYDAVSNRTQLKLDSNIHTTYNYDAANRLTTLTDEASQNFTFGNDIARGRVKYEAVYPGVDLVYYGKQRELEYDFIGAPNADPDQIKLEFSGSEKNRNRRGRRFDSARCERRRSSFQKTLHLSGNRRRAAGNRQPLCFQRQRPNRF